VAAENSGEGVASKHSALTRAASGDNEIASAGVKKGCGKDTDLNVGKLLLILCGIHTVIEYLMAEGLNYLLKSIADKSVLGSLAIFIYKSNFHCIYFLSLSVFIRE
jgi:hypothetical protein